jgi:hypothetical protein
MSEGMTGYRPELDVMRGLMGEKENGGKCTCRGGGVKTYRAEEGVPQEEIPTDVCEVCGGEVEVICINIVKDWREIQG